MIESKWLETWFTKLNDINDESTLTWKETTIKIYGVPLRGWGYQNFCNIGCTFGRVISLDYSSFEYARVSIISDCLFVINCKMAIEIDGNLSTIFILEEYKSPNDYFHEKANKLSSSSSSLYNNKKTRSLMIIESEEETDSPARDKEHISHFPQKTQSSTCFNDPIINSEPQTKGSHRIPQPSCQSSSFAPHIPQQKSTPKHNQLPFLTHPHLNQVPTLSQTKSIH